MKTSTIGKIVFAAILGASSASAIADSGDSAARFGIGAARVQVDMDDYDVKGSGTGWEIIAGWEFNRYLAIEASYLDAGNVNDKVYFDGLGEVKLKADTNAVTASVIGTLPINAMFGVYGRAGIMHWKSKQSASAFGQSVSLGDFDGDDGIFGVGVAAEIETALLRLEYRIAKLKDSDLSAASLSLVWRF